MAGPGRAAVSARWAYRMKLPRLEHPLTLSRIYRVTSTLLTAEVRSAAYVFKATNGHQTIEGAVIRTASFTRTLSAICTWTLPCIDPG